MTTPRITPALEAIGFLALIFASFYIAPVLCAVGS